LEHLIEFFNGLQTVSFSAALIAPPAIRPGEAMSLWLMEGKAGADISGVLTPSMHPFVSGS
jgi:hypothetical protein